MGSEATLKQLAEQKAQLASQEESIDLNQSLCDELQQLEEGHEEALEDLGVSEAALQVRELQIQKKDIVISQLDGGILDTYQLFH